MSTEMLTVNERLNQSITQLKRLHNLENKKKNQQQQAKNDSKFIELVHQVTQLCTTVHYAQISFSFPYQPQMFLVGLLNDLHTTASRGVVDEEAIFLNTRKVKPIQDQLKKEWANYYPVLVGSVRNTLRIIQKIDPDQINRCLLAIKSAELWQNNDSDLPRLQTLSEALTRSNDIISRLDLDQEITSFLTKISTNTSTLNDLTDGIMAWIRKENLIDKIMISFK